jgi:hypothetical protein
MLVSRERPSLSNAFVAAMGVIERQERLIVQQQRELAILRAIAGDVPHEGELLTITEAATRAGISRRGLQQRIKAGTVKVVPAPVGMFPDRRCYRLVDAASLGVTS